MSIPKGLKRLNFFSQGTYDSKHLRCHSLYILTGTDSRDNKQIKLYATYSRTYALWGPVPVPLSCFKPFRSCQCPHINQKKFKAGKGSQIAPSHRPRRQLASIAAHSSSFSPSRTQNSPCINFVHSRLECVFPVRHIPILSEDVHSDKFYHKLMPDQVDLCI